MLRRRALFATLSFTLVACATSADPNQLAATETETPDIRKGEEVRSLCFARNIDRFSDATNNSVVVEEGRQTYLIETFQRCHDLRYAQSLALRSTSLCLSKGDDILAFDSTFGPDAQSGLQPIPCKVKAIYEWDEDAVEAEDAPEAKVPEEA